MHVIRVSSITISIVDIRNMGVFHSVLLFLSPLSFPPHRLKKQRTCTHTHSYISKYRLYVLWMWHIHLNSIGIELVSHFVIVQFFPTSLFHPSPHSGFVFLFPSINQSNWFKFWIIKIFASILVGCIIFVPTKYISGSNMYGLVVIVIVVDGAVLRFDVRPPFAMFTQ